MVLEMDIASFHPVESALAGVVIAAALVMLVFAVLAGLRGLHPTFRWRHASHDGGVVSETDLPPPDRQLSGLASAGVVSASGGVCTEQSWEGSRDA